MKTVSIPDDVHAKLQDIISKRKDKSNSRALQSNRSVISELIDKAYKREVGK